MKQVIILFCSLLMLSGSALAGEMEPSQGAQRFACMNLEWQSGPGRTVNIRLMKDAQPLSQFTLSPKDPYRHFAISSENTVAEGRMRLRFNEAKGKGILQLDALSYRCSSPRAANFSGILEEFALLPATTHEGTP